MNVGDIFNSNKPELTQDKRYNVGQISEKTGLQKQSDGSWAPPKLSERRMAEKTHQGVLNTLSKMSDDNPVVKAAKKEIEQKALEKMMSEQKGDPRSQEEKDAYARMNGSANAEEMEKSRQEALEFEQRWRRGEIDEHGNELKKADTEPEEKRHHVSVRNTSVSPNNMYDKISGNFYNSKHIEDLESDLADLGYSMDDVNEEYAVVSNNSGSQFELKFGAHGDGRDFTVEDFKLIYQDEDDDEDYDTDDSAPKLTGDSSIKLSHIVRDKRYNIGDISEKTGLQKTANGWVTPKETKYGKVTEKNGQIGIQQKLGKGSQFMPEKAKHKQNAHSQTLHQDTTQQNVQSRIRILIKQGS